jgi:hypothetical protein
VNLHSSLNHFSLALLSLLLSGISLNSIFWETLNSSLSRLGLFATCRRFIDRSLYNELKQISQSSSSGVSVELDTLPHPHAKPTSISERRTSNDSHSVLSKTIFSFCFSESCTLFLLLMCHGSDTLNTRCADYFILYSCYTCSNAPSTRLINWRISLYALLLNIILVIPVSLCVVCTTSLNSSESHIYLRHLRDPHRHRNCSVRDRKISPYSRHSRAAFGVLPSIILCPSPRCACLF